MQFAIVTALAAVASAATLEPRQAQEKNISEFSANCIPHSAMCSYSFKVESDPSLPKDTCSAQIQGTDGTLPAVEDGKCPDNVAYTWTVEKKDNGDYCFKIGYPFNSRSDITYCHIISAQDIISEQTGASVQERYVGATDFTASIFDC